jgi:oligopeptide transport system ATP-binding protein
LHPYTRALLSAIPVFDLKENRARKRIILEGEIPSPLNPPRGCVFSTRCPYVKDVCHEKVPDLIEQKKGHYVACHFAGQI